MSGPRRFDALRSSRAKPQSVSSHEESIDLVIRRHLLANNDGLRILDWMLNEVNRPTPLGCAEAVLREAEGARRFVQKLIDAGQPTG